MAGCLSLVPEGWMELGVSAGLTVLQDKLHFPASLAALFTRVRSGCARGQGDWGP